LNKTASGSVEWDYVNGVEYDNSKEYLLPLHPPKHPSQTGADISVERNRCDDSDYLLGKGFWMFSAFRLLKIWELEESCY
jgi:hypothetical protein